MLLGGCADTVGQRNVYIVRPQDTLYSIAWRYGVDYRDLARWNHIGPDFRIAIGQTLILAPDAAAPPRSAPRAPQGAPQGEKPKSSPSPQHSQSTAAAPMASGLWTWPTDRTSAPQPVPGGGILLPGSLGQDIRAAASGRVVYSGSGIRAYGNLIIIKHGENLLSAYAHTRESLVHEGQEVLLGQVIAHMGEGGPRKPVLYFEIRRNGRPVDPLGILPGTK